MGKQWKQSDFIFWGTKITADGVLAMKLKDACSLEESYDKPRQHIKKQRHYFVNKGPSVKVMVFTVVMYGGESQTIKKTKH